MAPSAEAVEDVIMEEESSTRPIADTSDSNEAVQEAEEEEEKEVIEEYVSRFGGKRTREQHEEVRRRRAANAKTYDAEISPPSDKFIFPARESSPSVSLYNFKRIIFFKFYISLTPSPSSTTPSTLPKSSTATTNQGSKPILAVVSSPPQNPEPAEEEGEDVSFRLY